MSVAKIHVVAPESALVFGQPATLQFSVYDEITRQPTDPTTLRFRARKYGAGPVIDLTEPDGDLLIKAGLGLFYAQFAPTEPGATYVRFETTGPDGAWEGTVQVAGSQFDA